MIVPVIAFTSGIILWRTTAFSSFRLRNSKIAIQIYERRIDFLSFEVYYSTIFRNINGFSNGSDLPILDGEHSLLDGCLRIYMDLCVFENGVIGISGFNTVIFWEIFLGMSSTDAKE